MIIIYDNDFCIFVTSAGAPAASSPLQFDGCTADGPCLDFPHFLHLFFRLVELCTVITHPTPQFPRTLSRSRLSLSIHAALLGFGIAAVHSATAAGQDAGKDTVLSTINVNAAPETANGAVQGFVATRSTTATKTDAPIIETPQAISVVTRDEMDARGVRSVGEAVAYTAGVASGGTGDTTAFGGNNVQIRGFGGGGTAGYSFNEYLDGMKLQGTGYDGGNLDPYLFERVEVLKGPASVLFGQTQPGGIVNTVSKRPTRDMVNEMRLGGGNHSHIDGGVDVGGALGPNLLYRITGSALQEHLQQDHSSRKRRMLAPALTWSNGTTSLTALAHVQKDDINGTILSLVPAAGVFGNPNGRVPLSLRIGDPNYEYWERSTWSLGYLFSHALDQNVTLRQNVRHTRNGLDSQWLYRRALGADRRTLQRTGFGAFENAATLTVDNQLEYKFVSGAARHTVLAGVDYVRRTNEAVRHFGTVDVPALDLFRPVYGQANIPVQPVYQSEDLRGRQLGIYVQDQVRIGALSLLAGGRYDDARADTGNRLNGVLTEQHDTAFSGRVGALYTFANGLAPYASYAESFEPVSGRGFDGAVFKPMDGEQYEIGVKYQLPDGASMLTLAAFDLTQQNMTTSDPEHVGFSIQTGEVRTRGIELEGKAQLGKALAISAAYTALDDEVTRSNNPDRGKRRAQIPAHSGSLWLHYAPRAAALAGLELGLGARYTGKTQGDNINSFAVPGRTLIDLAARYDLGRLGGLGQWGAELNVNNLTNRYYIGSCFATHSCYLGLERSVRGALKYRW